MKLSQKEAAELKREQTELETKRSELKAKCKNHRDMTVEELNGVTENLRSVSARLDQIQEQLKDAPQVEQRGGLGMLKDLKGNEITEENYRSSAKYRDAFYRSFLNNKVSEEDSEIMAFGKRAATNGMNGDGVTTGSEYLVPETTLNNVYSVIKQYGKLYSAITKFGFTGDVALPIGTADAPTTNDEGITNLTFTFTEVKISQMAVVATITVKNLLLRNSIPAFEKYLSMEIGKYIGILCENYVLNGSLSNSTFEGIITALKTTPSAAKTYSELDWKGIAGIMGGVESPYGDNATWVMKRSTFFNRFFALTDSTGKPIVTVTPLIQGQPGQDNYGSATPYLIAGQPVIFTSQMPDTDGILYGDLSTYVVNESESFTIESNTSEKFSEDKTVWRGKLYSGGKGTFPKETFVYYSYSAS
ncbi:MULTISPECIES: phage major capsid protein [unclassified Clostridium]|uniref:phage major capsid protein n=1 Tax=unclassified Clostridium TaxID=2614128 RepID=UPI000297B24B|nr:MULTISPECIES: phage major capsid protein [unclassified Clostridium]EKQ50271.1 MAG: phage major capsid protein, HK97 family [Clostridium sp. Maddingley MBC34-26]